ncbi:DUF3592 domain-containing protein [Streptomyces silvensis]|nr:DUF3592 domain-containing protein [Streptomyces silvensis]
MTHMTTRAPRPRVSRGVKRFWLGALLVVAGSVVVTLFGYVGHSRVLRLQEHGVFVRGTVVAVSTDGDGRTRSLTVRFRPSAGGGPVTAELPTSPPLPKAEEGRPIDVVYHTDDTSDVLTKAQVRNEEPDLNPLSVSGLLVIGGGLFVVASAAWRPRRR